MVSERPPRRWVFWACLAGVVLLGLVFVGVGCSTSWARIAVLRTVEPYGLAVHQQLLFNFADSGSFFQTIHTGYDDAWTWSGHRAATLPLVGILYGLAPSPFFLTAIAIGLVALGVVPAAALGRRALRHPAGMLAGALLYLGCPAVMGLALQDYQDLVFALPLLLCTLWAMRAQQPWMVAIGALLGCLPREECLPLVVAAAIVSIDLSWERPWLRWARNVGIAVAVALVYGLLLALVFPVGEHGYEVPVGNAFGGFVDPSQRLELFGLRSIGSFYGLIWAPLGLVGLAAPVTALPGLVLLLLHMTVPWGLGVDRVWGGHAHHVAPMVPFFVCAAILGAARVLRGSAHPRLGSAGRVLPWVLAAGALGYLAWFDLTWARRANLVLRPWPSQPQLWHPAWVLVPLLPVDAAPIVPLEVSLAVSDRARSYTFSESLLDKAPGRGLGAGTHLIVHRDNALVRSWGEAMPGAVLVAESEPFLLMSWDRGAVDPTMARWGRQPPERITTWPFRVGGADELPPGVAPPEAQPELPVLPVEPPL